MNSNLLILGAGGHGRVVREIALLTGLYKKIDFLDDSNESAVGVCSDYVSLNNEYEYAIPAFGDGYLREIWTEKLEREGYKIPKLIHPSAILSPTAKIQNGVVVAMGAVINCGSVIERGCIIGIGSLIDHDSKIEEFSYIKPGVLISANTNIPPRSNIRLHNNKRDISIIEDIEFEIGV